jgi:hypothetical protein
VSSEDGWPDVPGDTALTIRIPEADAFVQAPFPAHVTVLYPFLPAARITPEVHAELSALFADRDPFDLTFAEFRRYPGVLYLPPAPEDPVRTLTKSLRERWPEAVPYRACSGRRVWTPTSRWRTTRGRKRTRRRTTRWSGNCDRCCR